MNILKDNLLKLVAIFFLAYSANCFAAINLELSNIAMPNDLSSVKPFINSSDAINLPVNSSDIKNSVNSVNNKLSNALAEKYPNLNILTVESGIVFDMTRISSESSLSHHYNADLLLYGELSNFNSMTTIDELEETGQKSEIYYLNIAIHYQLFRVKDKKVLADFIAVGGSGNSEIQSSQIHFDYLTYLPQVSNELFNSALNGIVMAFDSKDIFDKFESDPAHK